MAEFGELPIGDGADGVLVLGPCHAEVYQLSAHGFELSEAWATSAAVSHSAVQAALG